MLLFQALLSLFLLFLLLPLNIIPLFSFANFNAILFSPSLFFLSLPMNDHSTLTKKKKKKKKKKLMEVDSLFGFCDIHTSKVHKSLRGPFGNISFYTRRTKTRKQGMVLSFGNVFEQKIYFDLYISTKGSLYNDHICALAISFKQAIPLGCKIYMQQGKRNVLGASLRCCES